MTTRKIAYLLIAIALLALIVAGRAWHLDADPPTDLSNSTDVYTDPAQYTHFARNYVQFNDYNPYDDQRRTVFLKSTVTLLAVGVFRTLGVGVWQSSLVGLLYAVGALLLFFLFVRRTSGNLAALLFLLLICFDYSLLFYGKLPFREHAMAFYAFLSLVLISHFRSWSVHLLAGISLAVGILFGKMIGLVFLFPFACLLAYRHFFEDKKRQSLRPVAFATGFLIVGVFWYFLTYVPAAEQVVGYFDEQALSLYGTPQGLTSIDSFVWKMVSFDEESELFQRLPGAALLAALLIGMIVYRAAIPRSWRTGFGVFNSGHVFIAAMIIAFYGSLMIWNYRPLRYQLVLIYPVYGAAATILSLVWHKRRALQPRRTPFLFYLFIIPLVMVPFYELCAWVYDRSGRDFQYEDNEYLLAIGSVVLSALIGYVIDAYRARHSPVVWKLGRIMVASGVIVMVTARLVPYYEWAQRPTFTMRDTSRDLGAILSPAAVVSGPYAPALTLENRLGCVIHMFGVSEPDSNLFRGFPITHLLTDFGNEGRAKEDYPDVMRQAIRVLKYHVANKSVKLFRIAGHTGNPVADSYQRSLFEEAADLYEANHYFNAAFVGQQFLMQQPDNFSGFVLMAQADAKIGEIHPPYFAYQKAVEFSPTNYDLNLRLAEYLKDRYIETGDPALADEARTYYEQALHLAPSVGRITQSYRKLKEDTTWSQRTDTARTAPENDSLSQR